jgi:hypothetical protein
MYLRIVSNDLISRYECEFPGDSLRHQQAIEWISMT